MTKSQLKQYAIIQAYAANGMQDAAARGLSAMVRAAMSNKSREALMNAAIDLGLIHHPEFLV